MPLGLNPTSAWDINIVEIQLNHNTHTQAVANKILSEEMIKNKNMINYSQLQSATTIKMPKVIKSKIYIL